MADDQTTDPVVTDPVVTDPVVTDPVVDTTIAPVVKDTPVNIFEGLSEELLKNERLAGVKSVEDLANRLVNAKIAPEIPAPDGYKLPEGVPKEIGQFAHDNGLTQVQLDGVVKHMTEWKTSQNVATHSQLAEQAQAKISEWGDKANDNVALATQAVSHFETVHPGLKQMLNETGYGNHPIVMEIFKSVGEMMKEGGFVSGDTYTPSAKKTAAQIMFPNQGK